VGCPVSLVLPVSLELPVTPGIRGGRRTGLDGMTPLERN
jgi:hypothetical protein